MYTFADLYMHLQICVHINRLTYTFTNLCAQLEISVCIYRSMYAFIDWYS